MNWWQPDRCLVIAQEIKVVLVEDLNNHDMMKVQKELEEEHRKRKLALIKK